MNYTTTVSDKSKDQFKTGMVSAINNIIDEEELQMGTMYLMELLSLEQTDNYVKFQHLVDLKRTFSSVSVNNIAQLLTIHMSKADLEELKGKI